VLGCEDLRRFGRGLCELGHVAKPLALGAQGILAVGLQAVCALDEPAELLQALGSTGGCACDLVTPASRGSELPPGAGVVGPAAHLFLPDEGIEDVELKRRPGQAPLLELAGHGQQALDQSSELLSRDRPSPGVGAGTAVREHTPCRDDPVLVLGPQLCERRERLVLQDSVGQVEVRLDVRLARPRPQVSLVPRSAEEEADGLGEDRLPRAGLAGHRVQARPEIELGLADEDEVLDAKMTKHGGWPYVKTAW
jgi:hypothetical protein